MHLTVLFNVPMMFNECLLASLGEGALLVFETWRSSAIDSINLKARLPQLNVFCLLKCLNFRFNIDQVSIHVCLNLVGGLNV